MRKPTIQELCERYNNEDAHGMHVARLALALFDAMRGALRLNPAMRYPLEAAALLHDIGYSVDRAKHASAGAEIVSCEGLRGLSKSTCGIIAQAIFLHQKSTSLSQISRKYKNMPANARRLAAFLRIADGLDHSHIQNSEIISIRRFGRRFDVSVKSPGYRNNIKFAEIKTELWRDEFAPFSLRIISRDDTNEKLRFSCAVQPDDSRLDAARRILFLMYRTMCDNRPGAIAGDDPEYLHDLRTSLRRFNAALRIFRKPLLSMQIKTFSSVLGAARDLDVWLAYLGTSNVLLKMRASTGFNRYVKTQLILKKRYNAQCASALKSKQYNAMARSMAYFLRVYLPDRIRQKRPDNLRKHAARSLFRIYKKLLEHEAMLPDDAGLNHIFRKNCRRARYTAEFFAPALGPHIEKFAGKLKKTTEILGELHDRDVGLARTASNSNRYMKSLRRILAIHRKKLSTEAQREWNRLQAPRMSGRIEQAMSRLINN
jgi:exopolyphosphatase/guanosine-5'-triphosphate,3'-diphosphate pyrophosphatase